MSMTTTVKSHVLSLVATLPDTKRCRHARLDSACLVEEASAHLQGQMQSRTGCNVFQRPRK